MAASQPYPTLSAARWQHLRRKVAVVDHGFSTPCWCWTGSTWNGYAKLSVTHAGRASSLRMHRVFYEHLRGPIPAGLHLDHLCRRRNCVNPWHLEPVTVAENNARSPRGRQALKATHCRRGHEYTPDSAYTYRGKQVCRVCKRQRERSYRGREVVA